MMASNQVIRISERFKLIKPTSRKSWPWAIQPDRILVLFLPWMNSHDKHHNKYINVYSDMGLDVLCMKSYAMDFLWPPRSLEAGRSLIKILENQGRDYDIIFIHSMSVGAFNLTSVRTIVNENETKKYLLEKVCGIIYDSVVVGAGEAGIIRDKAEIVDGDNSVDVTDLMIKAVAKAISERKLFLSSMKVFMKLYFALTKSETLDYYSKGYDIVRDQPLRVPTLVLASKDDPMTDYKVVQRLTDIWRNDHSVPVHLKLWDKSGHAQHLVFHNEEYLDVHRRFMSGLFTKSKL